MLYSKKLSYFAKPVEVVFNFSAPLLVMTSLGIYAYKDISKLSKPYSWVLIVAILLVIIVFQLPQLKKKLGSLLIAVKRVVYVELLNRYSHSQWQGIKYLIGKIIHVPFRYGRLNYSTQNRILEEIHSSLKENDRSIFLIEGKSGSGKSTLVPFLMRKIIADKNTSHFSEGIYFFDFAKAVVEQKKFIELYGRSRMHQSIIIIDNFHRVRDHLLRQITQNIIDCHSGCIEKCVILLSQPLHKFSGGTISDFRLISQIKKTGKFRKLDIENIPDRDFDYLFETKNSPIDAGLENYIPHKKIFKIHYARVFSYAQRFGDNIHLSLLKLENAIAANAQLQNIDTGLLEILGIVVGLTIHREGFSMTDLRETIKHVKRAGKVSRFIYYLKSRRMVRHLAASGFIVEGLHSQKRFSFHQKLSSYYKDKLISLPEFRTAFEVVIGSLKERAISNQEYTMAWLYSFESSQFSEMLGFFHDALMEGQIKMMHDNLSQRGTDPQTFSYSYQLGLLHEKVGQFELARTELRRALHYKNPPEYTNFVNIFLIEAEHGEDSLQQLRSIRNNTSPTSLEHFIARYWEVHIQSHFGVFELNDLARIMHEKELYGLPVLRISLNNHKKATKRRQAYELPETDRLLYFSRPFSEARNLPVQSGTDQLGRGCDSVESSRAAPGIGRALE